MRKGAAGDAACVASGDRWLYAWGIGYLAAGVASLLIPLYALSLGGGAFVVGVLAATVVFAGIPGALLWGSLAARSGRRRAFVRIALGATAIILAATPFVEVVWALVAVNALLWFVLAAAAPVLNLLILEGTPQVHWERRIAKLNAYQGYGWLAGLILGSVWIPITAELLDPAAARTGLFWVCASRRRRGPARGPLAPAGNHCLPRCYHGLDVAARASDARRREIRSHGPLRHHAALLGAPRH